MNALATSDELPEAASDLAVLDDPLEQQRFTRWSEDASGKREAESSLQLLGMYCAACAGIIEAALGRVDGVAEVQVSAAGQRAKVRWDPARTQVSALIRAVRQAGYDAVPDAAAPAREMRRVERRDAIWRVFVASFCAMQVMMLAEPSYVARGDDLAPDLRQLLNWGSWLVSIPVLVFSAGPFFLGAWRSLRQRRISMDVPVVLGLLVTFVTSTGVTFDPTGPFGTEVYFDSLTMFVSFLLIGRFVEMTARHRAAESLEKTISGMPETAQRVLPDGSHEVVSTQRLRVGDLVRVALGAAFPADGRLTEGETQADESLLTGESLPIIKKSGDELVGGSVNLGAPVLMRVERVGADTRLEAVVAMMRDALSQRPALARWADTWAGPFLWAVLVLAAGAAAVWSVVDPSRAVWVAVSVLIVTCPCALSLAAPSALVVAAGALARRGLMVQRLDALEVLANMDRLYTDKTGTVTEDRAQWVGTQAIAEADLATQAIWQTSAAQLASWSVHPLSKALAAQLGGAAGVDVSVGAATWHGIQEQPGAGIQGLDELGRAWRLGSRAWVESDAGLSGAEGARLAEAPASEYLSVWLGSGGQVLLRFDFDEKLRPDAQQALRALQADGVEVSLLSGDAPARVAKLSSALGLSESIGGATPQQKLEIVAQAQAAGRVVGMLGDGVNDAPVLARANVSFAMGQGALVSRVHADAVIVSNRLADLVWARRLARRTMLVIRQNLVWAAVYNSACIPLALLGYLPPWAAGLGMAASSLMVIGNSWRLARYGSTKA